MEQFGILPFLPVSDPDHILCHILVIFTGKGVVHLVVGVNVPAGLSAQLRKLVHHLPERPPVTLNGAFVKKAGVLPLFHAPCVRQPGMIPVHREKRTDSERSFFGKGIGNYHAERRVDGVSVHEAAHQALRIAFHA